MVPMTSFPLPDVLHRTITGEIERAVEAQQISWMQNRSETTQQLARAKEMLWRSRQLLGFNGEEKSPQKGAQPQSRALSVLETTDWPCRAN
jgi:cell division septum initiation protein DivIVA